MICENLDLLLFCVPQIIWILLAFSRFSNLQVNSAFTKVPSISKGWYPNEKSAHIWALSKAEGGGHAQIQIVRGTFFCLDLDVFPGGGRG